MADVFSVKKRSWVMSRIRGKYTTPERVIFNALRRSGVPFRKHYMHLPGRPDAVLLNERIAIFIDGDFWHGYRYPAWKKRISTGYWRQKIENNRRRDRNNFKKIRRAGWHVVRIWEHQIEGDFDKTLKILLVKIKKASQ